MSLKYLNPRRDNIFFSKFQKNWNCPNRAPIIKIRTWYMGNIIAILIGQNSQGERVVLFTPIMSNNGLATQRAIDPVTEKTIRIISS